MKSNFNFECLHYELFQFVSTKWQSCFIQSLCDSFGICLKYFVKIFYKRMFCSICIPVITRHVWLLLDWEALRKVHCQKIGYFITFVDDCQASWTIVIKIILYHNYYGINLMCHNLCHNNFIKSNILYGTWCMIVIIVQLYILKTPIYRIGPQFYVIVSLFMIFSGAYILIYKWIEVDSTDLNCYCLTPRR